MQIKVSSTDLKIGMFVSSLDRPWIDTPFMFQGFLIENDEDIQQLQKYCEFVHVDWDRSPLGQPIATLNPKDISGAVLNKQSLGAKHTTVDGSKSPTVGINNKASGQPEVSDLYTIISSSNTKSRGPSPKPASKDNHPGKPNTFEDSDHDGFLSDITGKVMNFFKRNSLELQAGISPKQQRSAIEDRITNERISFIPGDIPLSMYVDTRPVEEEVAPAVKAHARANEILNNLVQDIKSNKHLALKETEAVVQEVVDSMVRNPDAMMWITRLRKQDELVYGHGLQVAVYLVALGRHLGLPKDMLERLCTVGLLLDIGKIKLPKELLLKKGRLTQEEFETVKSHVQLALDILKETPDIHADVLQGIAQHHERENGSGYPAGLCKGEISLFGRMSAVVDSFTALTNPRSYAETMPAYEALQCISNFNPDLYQATMLEQFIQAIGVFPVGSMVELSSGEVAVVIAHSKVRRLKPRVLIISDSNKCPSPHPTTLDLLYQSLGVGESEVYIQRGLPTGAFGLDNREYYLA